MTVYEDTCKAVYVHLTIEAQLGIKKHISNSYSSLPVYHPPLLGSILSCTQVHRQRHRLSKARHKESHPCPPDKQIVSAIRNEYVHVCLCDSAVINPALFQQRQCIDLSLAKVEKTAVVREAC